MIMCTFGLIIDLLRQNIIHTKIIIIINHYKNISLFYIFQLNNDILTRISY